MYYPKVTAKPLEFGVAYHKAMEVYYSPDTWNWVKNPYKRPIVIARAVKAFRDKCNEQKDKYLDTFGDLDPDVRTDYEERLELGCGMLDYHLESVYFKDQNFTPLAVEVPFEVPILDPDTGEQLHCNCNVCWSRFLKAHQGDPDFTELTDGGILSQRKWLGFPVTYGGRLDMLAQDRDLRYWIYDWKTAARLHSDNDEFLDLDWQISSYCWALTLKLNLDVAGFVYHEQKKSFPRQPEPHKSGRRYQGKLFTTNKMQDTDYATYKATVEENDPEGYADGAYEEFLEYLKACPTRYAERYQKYRNEYELQQVGRDLYLIASDMTDPKLRIYPNSGRFGCGSCAFRVPCIGMNRGEDVKYTLETLYEKRTWHYWETKEPSTDSKGGE